MFKKHGFIFSFFICLFFFAGHIESAQTIQDDESDTSLIDVTVIGAYGDLAKKYLWKGFFDLYLQHEIVNKKKTFRFFGAARQMFTEGNGRLKNVLYSVKFCQKTNKTCNEYKSLFLQKITYVQLKSSADYENHCHKNLVPLCSDDQNCQHYGQRIFYLSVPPFTYEGIGSHIFSKCRSNHDDFDLKVVVEKPFGHNYKSALGLANTLFKFFKEDELYRIDHYLGKEAVQAIDLFRNINQKFDALLNRQHVEKIEVVMKEVDDVKGRTSFYDKYGVVNDVMQNHLSEIVYKITKELPGSKRVGDRDLYNLQKINLQKKIDVIRVENDIVYAQYEDYANEVKSETGHSSSHTPTFASVLLKVSSSRWRDVPVIISAGKKLDERVGYARICFKNRISSVNVSKDAGRSREVVFYIGHGQLKTPAIIVSKSLQLDSEATLLQRGWMLTKMFDHLKLFGGNLDESDVYIPAAPSRDAYSYLIERIFLGERHHFISTGSLLESWRVWDSVSSVDINEQSLLLYATPKKIPDIVYGSHGIRFQNVPSLIDHQSSIVGNITSGDRTSVIERISRDIMLTAKAQTRLGRAFHVAFSGGSSPLGLFDHIATALRDEFDWEYIHVWQVDERCTCDETLSNFHSLQRRLIDRVPLRYETIHPMIYHHGCDCSYDALALKHYEEAVRSVESFDYIVLGLGQDGHVASLFPGHDALKENERYVTVAESIPNVGISKRMTLTYRAILACPRVSLLVLGDEKKSKVLDDIITGSACDNNFYPVCKVINNKFGVKWFIDRQLLPHSLLHDEL